MKWQTCRGKPFGEELTVQRPRHISFEARHPEQWYCNGLCERRIPGSITAYLIQRQATKLCVAKRGSFVPTHHHTISTQDTGLRVKMLWSVDYRPWTIISVLKQYFPNIIPDLARQFISRQVVEVFAEWVFDLFGYELHTHEHKRDQRYNNDGQVA